MTDPTYTHVTLVIDRSASMYDRRGEAQAAINRYIGEQRGQPGRLTFTLIDFDDRIQTVVDFQPITVAPQYRLMPRGLTALYDAVGRAIVETGQRLAALPEDERPGQVLVAIVTDGRENASHDWTRDGVRALIAEQGTRYAWTFVFLGAADAAWTGTELGIAHTGSYSTDPGGTTETWSNLSTATTCLRRGGQITIPPVRGRSTRDAAPESGQ